MKSQIAAVGGGNWSTFLGLLHWMMQLARLMQAYEAGTYDDACFRSWLSTFRATGSSFDFLSDAYSTWLSAEDDDDDDEAAQERHMKPHIDAMAAKFDAVQRATSRPSQAPRSRAQIPFKTRLKKLGKSGPRIQKLEEQIRDPRRGPCQVRELQQVRWIAKVKKYTDRCSIFLEKSIEEVEAELETLREGASRATSYHRRARNHHCGY